MTIDNPTTTMRAYPLEEFGGVDVLRQVRRPVPVPGRHEVLVRIGASGVCGQDLMRRGGHVDRVLGAVIGHEMAGTVVAVGADVEAFAVGDRVANTQRRACHRCDACQSGATQLCPSGVMYGESIDGGYAEFCAIDEMSLVEVPARVSFDQAAVAACAVGTGLHALRIAQVRAGETVLVTGASGGVGIHALQLAAAMGAQVVAVTTSESKAPLLAQHAHHVVVADGGSFEAVVRRRSLQPHVVLDLTAAFTLKDSLRAARRGGRVVIVGNLENRPVDVLPAAFIVRELSLLGSKACTRADLKDSLDFIDRGVVEVQLDDPLTLDEATKAHSLLEAGAVRGRVVLHP